MCYLLLYLMLLRILFFLILLMSIKPTASENALVGTIISTHEMEYNPFQYEFKLRTTKKRKKKNLQT